MSSLTVRGVDDEVKRRLRLRAAEAGRSMEAEVRAILQAAVAAAPGEPGDWFRRLREAIGDEGGVDLGPYLPARHDDDGSMSSRGVPFTTSASTSAMASQERGDVA